MLLLEVLSFLRVLLVAQGEPDGDTVQPEFLAELLPEILEVVDYTIGCESVTLEEVRVVDEDGERGWSDLDLGDESNLEALSL